MNAASGLGDLTMDEGAREHQVTRMDWSSSRDMQRLELDLELGWSLGQDKPRTRRRGKINCKWTTEPMQSAAAGWLRVVPAGGRES